MAFLLVCALLAAFGSICAASHDFSRPVTAAEYQGYLGQGFNANYFKYRDPLAKYNPQNIQILKDLGFRNLRIRCVASLYDDYHSELFRNEFLANLMIVVDDCIDNGIAPIVTFRHRQVENYGTEENLQKYLDWWRIVAEELRDKSYLLSFNLFTELEVSLCRNSNGTFCWNNWKTHCCNDALKQNTELYHRFTSEVISLIRGTGGNNAQRILILASPKKTTSGLQPRFTDTSYMDSYMMMDWHNYAAGPNGEKVGNDRDNRNKLYWSGKGTDIQKGNVMQAVREAKYFTRRTGIPTYQGEWQPRDNRNGLLNQMEVMSFAKYFVELCKNESIPLSLNSFDQYYDTETSARKIENQTHTHLFGGRKVNFEFPLNMSLVLDTIVDAM